MSDCCFTGYPNKADSFVSWGPAVEQQGNLCLEHINAVWVKAQPLISAGKLFWVQEAVKEEL